MVGTWQQVSTPAWSLPSSSAPLNRRHLSSSSNWEIRTTCDGCFGVDQHGVMLGSVGVGEGVPLPDLDGADEVLHPPRVDGRLDHMDAPHPVEGTRAVSR